ncbi:MAG: response regulator transcription factor [Sphingomonas sp.]
MELHRTGEAHTDTRPVALVVSDVLIYREGIAAGLTRIGDLRLVGAISSEALPGALAAHAVQIIFLDISRTCSHDAARAARALAPKVQVIGFGMTSEDEGLAGAEAGVTAFVDHDGTIEDLNLAATRVLSGLPVCPPGLTARLLQRVAQLAGLGRVDPDAHLTRREREIASLVEEGLSNKEIACTLNISPATVKNHVHMILDKLNLTRRRMIMLDNAPHAGLRLPRAQGQENRSQPAI